TASAVMEHRTIRPAQTSTTTEIATCSTTRAVRSVSVRDSGSTCFLITLFRLDDADTFSAGARPKRIAATIVVTAVNNSALASRRRSIHRGRALGMITTRDK